jgi:LysR family transcriptional regulator, hydrogen peroxide-inducible genes activator
MEMHQVRYFLALAEAQNFTRAGERCKVTQPALSRAIKLLKKSSVDRFSTARVHRHISRTLATWSGRTFSWFSTSRCS